MPVLFSHVAAALRPPSPPVRAYRRALQSGRAVALVPLRAPGHGKTRLAEGLSQARRAALAAAMLADVVLALRAAPVDAVVVAAADPGAAALASSLGAVVLRDPPGADGLNLVVDAAARRLSGTHALLVVAADLPCITGEDVEAVVTEPSQVVVAPTADGGTGVLLRRPPTVVRAAFGPGSAAAHVALATSAGVSSSVVDREGLRHDVDTWDDLQRLRERDDVGPATTEFLRRLSA